MKYFYLFSFISIVVTIFPACEKETGPDELGGNTRIALTATDSSSYISGDYNGQYFSNSSMTVKSNNDGIVTYVAKIDVSQFSTDIKIKAINSITQLMDYYKFDSSGGVFNIVNDVLTFEFKLKVTSEGYLDYFMEGKPWVIGRYADGVGTKYSIKNSKGEILTREIMEKTGIDEWPIGFWLIKTSKIEQMAPADDPVIDKVIYRINHKFGLVYVEYQLKDGTKLKLNVWAWFI